MKTIVFAFCTLFYMQTFGQKMETDTKKAFVSDYDYFMKKSKTQKTVAWSLLGGGTVLFIAGSAALGSALNGNGETESANFGAVAMFLGTIAPLASIPVFIASGNNRRKAEASLQLKPSISYLPISNNIQPVVSITIPIQKNQIFATHKTK